MSAACRGCGGTGIGAHITPREAQLLTQKIFLIRYANGVDPQMVENSGLEIDARVAKRYCRVDAWNGLSGEPCTRGRLAMSGSLAYVIAEVKRWLAEGWQIEPGSQMPDESAACEWCAGTGRAGHALSVHAMEEAIDNQQGGKA